jgi:hypothetical protein
VAVGFDPTRLQPYFGSVSLLRRLDNRLGVDDDEQQVSVRLCRGLKTPWPAIWGRLKNYG